jgi:arylsulfatase
MRISEACVVNLKNKSHTVTANITVPESGATGVIVNQGGSVGGWSMYAHEGKLTYCYNFLGIELSTITAEEPLPAGKHQVRMAFAYDGGGLAKGGDITLYYDGKPVGAGRVERTQPMMYSSDEACDVGFDSGSPVSPDYGPTGNKFSGEIEWVQIDLGDDSQDHLIKPEDRLTVAMSRQ